jgi:predicted ATPase/two-component sensor histidine kinase/tRNA A-37 threonylcarbamoyl transferase component Bud32
MLSLPGYFITSKIYESPNSRVYRGIRELDSQPLVLKTLRPDYPTPDELMRYRQEYEITRSLTLEGVIQVYGMETHQNSLVMFLEDFGGESLAHWLTQRSFSLTEVLTLAIRFTEILGQVHQQQVIHKDINPSNLVWNPATGQLKLIDFGIASRITRETPTLRNPNVLEGTLAYMSPEQTGRMNRSIDYRTDFYSLGVTLYELLTQQLPFIADDALELVHCHLAKTPMSPSDRGTGIPQPVSAIVMKLLAKTAEERYQSYRGIQADLENCLTQLQTTQEIAAFPLAQHDRSDTFHIPQKLYGREREVETLLAAFGRVGAWEGRRVGVGEREGDTQSTHSSTHPPTDPSTTPQSEFMLISGYSGIGKTSLVQEIYKPITQQRGYFITGKFDQYQRDIPYSAFVSAFSRWVEQLLTESEMQLHQWREKLLSALEPNAQVMVDVIPELELVLGAQPPVPELPPTETRNRFNRVLQQFIQVLAQPDHPLVIFLDDLQWVDAASLQLIQVLMATNIPCLFLIGAYRDNEVSATHPLTQAIEEMQKAGITIETIALSPLQKLDVQHLLADTLNCSVEAVATLADLVLAKTDGNPFFVNEFLRALYVEQLLTFDYQHSEWQWSISEIQQRNITDNVVELLIRKIQRLEQTTQDALRQAACIGNRFDLQTLTFVLYSAGLLEGGGSGRSPLTPLNKGGNDLAVPLIKGDLGGSNLDLALSQPPPSDASQESSLSRETIALLKEAVNIGLIMPLNDSYKRIELGIPKPDDAVRMEYKFAHDRIQQAAYSLNSEAERPAIHWQIGQQILHHTSLEQREQRIFDIVNQLNLGVALVQSAEQLELVRLNLLAAQKAKASAAYTAAIQYLKTALTLLPGDSWNTEYDLSLALYTLVAEAAYLNGNLKQTEQFAAIVLERAQSLPEKVKIYEVQIQAYGSQMQFLAALQIGLKTLEELGVVLSVSPTAAEVEAAFAETTAILADRQIQALIDLPPMTDAIATQSLRILTHLLAPSYQAAPPLFPLLILKMVNLSVTYGNHELSAFAYAAYANILNCVILDLDQSYQFVQLGLQLLERFHNPLIRCKTLFMANCSVRFNKVHVKETIQPLQEAYQLGIESGDIEFAAYSILHHCDHYFFVGMPLAEVERKITGYIEALTQLQESTNTNALRVYQQTIVNLTQPSPHPTLLIGDIYDESQELPLLQQANHQKGLFYLYFNKLLLSCYFQDAERAVENADQANCYPDGGRSNAVFPIFHFYDSLARLMQYPTANPTKQAAIRQRVAENQEKMQLWAHHAPMNNLHRWHLIEAERHRVLGDAVAAITNYDRAADLAREHGYIQEQALAHERTALFYLEQGKEILARAYLQEARYCYLKWGATAKVNELETHYARLFSQTGVPKAIAANPKVSLTTTGSSSSETLDLATVIKASQALSGELNLEKLLGQLMTLVLQNAGAQTGTLLLANQQHFCIEATGTVDPIAITIHPSIPLEDTDQLPISLIQYVIRKQETVILEDAMRDLRFASDRYIQSHQPKSVLCTPIQGHGKLIGILYLENNLTTDAFTLDRATILHVLTAQAAIALENTRLYEQLATYSQTLEANNQTLQQEVSDRRRAEEQLRQSLTEREVLLKEIHHRVKNNLQIISGLLQLQSQSVTDTATTNILRESQHRIESMSLIHKKLYASSDFGEIDLSDYIPSLASNLLASYQIMPGHITLNMDIAPVLLNIDQAIPCGLIVNELISNALKYAFPDDRSGEIEIYLPPPTQHQIQLIIRDNGIGLPENVDWEYVQSLGLSLVHDLVVEQLEGQLTVERQDGTTFRIQFPQAPLLTAQRMA